MSEPYVLPSAGCCWAGSVAYPHPCPWHPPEAETRREYVAVGATYEEITPAPPFPTLLVPGPDEPIDKYAEENERLVASWRGHVRERRGR